MGASGRRSEQGGAGGAPGAPRPASPRGRSGRSPSRGRRLSEALISQSRGEGLGDLTLGGTEAFKPVPGPLRPASQPPTSVRPSVCPRGGWAALSRTSGRVRSWGGPSRPCGRGRSWVRQGRQVREQLPPPSTPAGGAADCWGAAAAPPPPRSLVKPSAPSGGSSFHRAGRRQARDSSGGWGEPVVPGRIRVHSLLPGAPAPLGSWGRCYLSLT